MKVLDLHCSASHVFEGWFASEDDFQDQARRGLVECPVCGDTHVTKKLSAPRLNLGAAEVPGPAAPAAPAREMVAGPQAAMQAAWMKAVRHVLAHTEDVGERFAQEARSMHYGETEERSIRGQTTPQEAAQLLEEGIEVMPLPIPKALKGPMQ